MATTVTCSFMIPKGAVSVDSLGVSGVRTRENLTAADGTTTAVAEANEVALVVNGTASAVAVAYGTTPDAATTAATAASSAGFGLGSNAMVMVVCAPGDKINVKTIA